MTPGRDMERLRPVDVENVPTLQLEDIQQEAEPALVARGAAYAREYARIVDKPAILAKNLATVLVALRVKHGDMIGRSWEYKQQVSEIYRLSGVPTDDLERVQNAVRWHVGNVLRRHMTPRELAKHELLPTSPLERLQDSRAINAAVITAYKASEEVASSTPRKKGKDSERVPEQKGHPVKATADHLRLAHVAATIVGQLDTDVIDSHMTAGQLAKLDDELAALQKTVAALRRHTRKPSSKA